MGRDAGYLALWCGIANGAERILMPEEHDFDEQEIIDDILKNKKIFFLKIFTQGNPLRGVGGCNFLQLFTSYRTVLELLKSSPIIYFFANID